MDVSDTLLTVASWEERFILGLEATLAERRIARVIMYYLDQHADWSEENRATARVMCESKGIAVEEEMLSWSRPTENWRVLKERVRGLATGSVVVDATTMPREIIWSTLWLCEWRRLHVEYVYHRPVEYNDEWLSRDPSRPRLVFKMSGLAQLGARTVLVLLAGYDSERSNQLIRFFEPSKTLLGLQESEGDKQSEEKMMEHAERCQMHRGIEIFRLNAYADDHGEAAITEQLGEYLESYNVVMSSLGPKLSALALYRIFKSHPEVGLAYAPSGEINRDYSKGLRQTYCGVL